jgi:hypothetical protein
LPRGRGGSGTLFGAAANGNVNVNLVFNIKLNGNVNVVAEKLDETQAPHRLHVSPSFKVHYGPSRVLHAMDSK